MLRANARSYQPASIEKHESDYYSLVLDPRTSKISIVPLGENPPGTVVVPRFRRACRSVVERAAKRFSRAARNRAREFV